MPKPLYQLRLVGMGEEVHAKGPASEAEQTTEVADQQSVDAYDIKDVSADLTIEEKLNKQKIMDGGENLLKSGAAKELQVVDMHKNDIKNLDRLAWWLDSSIRVPGTSWRIGLDGLIGLIPGIGDLTAGALSSYILLQAVKMGLPGLVIARMALNIIFESVLGTIPLLGDAFDFAFKANQRNVRLMRRYQTDPGKVKKRSVLTVIAVVMLVIAALVLAVWLAVELLSMLFNAVIG